MSETLFVFLVIPDVEPYMKELTDDQVRSSEEGGGRVVYLLSQ
jgi:hypothetical protein